MKYQITSTSTVDGYTDEETKGSLLNAEELDETVNFFLKHIKDTEGWELIDRGIGEFTFQVRPGYTIKVEWDQVLEEGEVDPMNAIFGQWDLLAEANQR